MSHPDPMDNPDNRRQEDDERRSEEELLAESIRISNYANQPRRASWERNEVSNDGWLYLGDVGRRPGGGQ
jgi:hypothetical protein